MKEIVFNSQMTEKSKRRNLMFSATIPQNVINVSEKFMNDSYLITSSNKNDIGNANANVKQVIEYVEDNDKIQKLHAIFQKIQGNAIIFLETKRSVDNLENFLERRNYNVVAIHGDKPQNKRQEAIQYFSSGEVPILIATDVASRGLDFPSVSYVFNFDMPKNIEDYIHRIGRTGRVGNKGTAISFFNSKNSSIAKDLVGVLEKMNQEIPEFLLEYYDDRKNYYQRKKNYSNNYYKSYSNNNSNGNNYNNSNNNTNSYNTSTSNSNGYGNQSYNNWYHNRRGGGYYPRGRGGYRNNNYSGNNGNYSNNRNNYNGSNSSGGNDFWRGQHQ